MMRLLASKFIYEKDLGNLTRVLKPFKNLSIQLAFFHKRDFFEMDHNSIKKICDSLNIDIPTVHAPTVDVFDTEFLNIIKTIKDVYKVKPISIHPQMGEASLALAKLQGYADILRDLEVILAYENFPSIVGKRKWIWLPTEMYSKFNLPFLKLTFDTSHLDSPSDCIEEFDRVFDKVEIIHLSDTDKKGDHLPLGLGLVPYQQFLKHLKICDFKGLVILEYMDEYETKLLEDVKLLIDNI